MCLIKRPQQRLCDWLFADPVPVPEYNQISRSFTACLSTRYWLQSCYWSSAAQDIQTAMWRERWTPWGTPAQDIQTAIWRERWTPWGTPAQDIRTATWRERWTPWGTPAQDIQTAMWRERWTPWGTPAQDIRTATWRERWTPWGALTMYGGSSYPCRKPTSCKWYKVCSKCEKWNNVYCFE